MTNTLLTYGNLATDNLYKAFEPKPNAAKDLAQAKETAQDFEAFFMSRMMESMFEGISTDGMFGGGHAEKIYRSMLFNEYGKVMAKTGTIGISDSIMDSIIKMQEAQSNNAL